jgi:DNA polymerase-3 subunit alpha
MFRLLKCLTAASSTIRPPGVAESGMMQEFIARHKNPAKRKYLVPKMEDHPTETYGVMIYQEDVIKAAHHIVGLTLEEVDLMRRAMSGKMRSHKAMEQITNKFFVSSKSNGLTDEQANVYETFGYMVTRHPLNFFIEWLNDSRILKAKDMVDNRGKRVRMIG